MDVLRLLLLLLFLLLCVVGARGLSQALNPKTIRLLGWIVGLGGYVAWCFSFLKSNWGPGQGPRDVGIMLLWLVLLPCALLLAFPPELLKRWKIYLLAIASFFATEAYLVWSMFMILSEPNFDDSAGAMFAPRSDSAPCGSISFFDGASIVRICLEKNMEHVHCEAIVMAQQAHAGDGSTRAR
jgi:fatty acid desaturase